MGRQNDARLPELSSLKFLIMDEVFGSENFVSSILSIL